jgi:carboxypeptidase C (cathepsin A)
MLASLLMPVLLLFQIPGASPTPRPTETPQPRPTASPDTREEPTIVVRRSVRTPSRTLTYTVTTGYMPIKNAVSGDTEARVFYMAYTLENPPAGRPLMFSFNGGPGSASVWLHLGALGPRRVKMLDDGLMPPPPYELVDNEHTWLSETDMVFIDPVGTGYSRAVRPDLASKFFGVNGDIESVGDFIRMYLGRNERWASPLFLVGESYGTTRAAGLSNHLFERGIGLTEFCWSRRS